MSHSFHWVTIAIFLISEGTLYAEGAAGVGLKKSTWSKLCDLSEELSTITGDAAGRLEQILEEINLRRRAAMRAAVFAAKQPATNFGTQALILSTYFSTRAENLMEKLKNSEAATLVAATSKTAYLKGRIDDSLQLLADSKSTTNNACLLNTAGNGPANTATAGQIEGTICRLAPPSGKTINKKRVNIDGKNIKQLIFTSGTDNNQETTGTAGAFKCRLLDADRSASTGYADTQAISGGVHLAGGYIKLDQAGGNHIKVASQAELKSGRSKKETAYSEAITAVEQLDRLLAEAHGNETGELHTWETLTAVFVKLKLAKDPSNENELKKAITEQLGSIKDNIIVNIEKKINELVIPAADSPTKGQTTLGEISDLDQLVSLRGLYQLRDTVSREKSVSAQACNAEGGESAKSEGDKQKECERHHASQTDCDSKDFCTYNKTKDEDKRCVYNATKVKANNAPVAQTQTGGTAATSSDRCTKHTKKEECEAENKNVKAGEKSVCGWIEIKCKDFCNLVNNKSFLIPAFVSFLF
ncbi:Trypanosome variant surface glycoprotein (A-type) [Trypanosoma brucei equiperdum]|uniref:Trypanosome variant surface glycoprotein (A-type) n=1 Tax=Trypanosoma brucei equiperdum TaxID=630700 RepID=A0A3L6KU06_9TRYP|nr:Trypanosome variant surface glycoprotein (A-type) [Trypanosoma brucei equiperdum]RHW67389.1 Trypanosome variant surface glycoprotein (A-type) [Trypanosoma brucei equiperdum]RHW67391.1 Trypanosome variant surface glycoprotein (A-type) [Trypanosoma brucei equiperdum]RHW67394.1 Trypanosome variant surface glycoprotein (A-type) [Trypanosoma brucei equiperdum]